MAFAADQNQDPNGPNGPQNAQGQTPANQPPSNPTTGSAVGAAGGNKSPNQPTSSTAPAPFTNLQSYLNVNAPQIQNTANQVAGQLGNQYGQVTGDINKASQDFSTQVKSGYAAPNQDLVKQAAANPTDFAKDANNVTAFQKQLNNQYQGPNSFESTSGYGNAQGEAQNAVNQAQSLGNYSGLQSYLTSNVEKNPTQAMSALDTALVNQSPEAMNTIQSATQPLTNLNGYFQNQVGQNNALVTKAQNEAQQSSQFAKDAFTGANGVVPTFQNYLQNQLTQNRATATTQADQLRADLATGDAAKIGADLSKFNLDPQQKAGISDYLTALNRDYGKNIDISNAFNFNPATDVNAANTASSADYAKADALQKLLGGNSLLNPADASKAGTWNGIGNALDTKDVSSGLKNALIQSEIEKLNPQQTNAGSSSSGKATGHSLKDYLNVVEPGVALNQKLGQTISKGVSSIGDSISKVFGGGGHKDAVVNLPQFTMPDMGVPTQANAATMEKITDVFNKPLSTAGSYHEGAVYDLVDRLDSLKAAMDSGQLSPKEYASMTQPLIKYANQAQGLIMGASSQAANSVKPAVQRLQSYLNPPAAGKVRALNS